jgi:DNA-binding transcriptional ArsR family regulator
MIAPELIPLVAQRFKALAEPGRLALLAALQTGEQSVSDLVGMTGRGQPNVSQHLAQLVHAGLVASRRDGNRIYYRIADPYVLRICDAVCKSVGARGGSAPRVRRNDTSGGRRRKAAVSAEVGRA